MSAETLTQEIRDRLDQLAKELAQKVPVSALGNKHFTMAEIERLHTIMVIRETGSITAAADHLGVSRRTIHRHLHHWGISSKSL